MSDKRVALVGGKGWGAIGPAEYDSQAKSIAEYLELPKGESKEKLFASVEIIDGITEAEKKVLCHEVDILIFLSRGHVKEAKAIKAANPWLKVIVFTSLIPDDEIIWVNKLWPFDIFEGIVRFL